MFIISNLNIKSHCRPPSPEELELARMIIFVVFLRASEVGCFWGGRWDGVRGWLAEEERNRGEKKGKAGWRGGRFWS